MSDINYPPGDFADKDGITVKDLMLIPPGGGVGYADIFKNSHVTNSTFDGVTVVAGKQSENAWDANNGCSGNTYRRLKLWPGSESAVLLKDGFCGNTVDDVEIVLHGGHSDWYEGDYSDQGGTRNTGNAYNNVRMTDGSPIRVSWTFFRAEKPRFTDSVVRYQYLLSFFRTCYVEAKYLFPGLIP
jgi:hypothetical protein